MTGIRRAATFDDPTHLRRRSGPAVSLPLSSRPKNSPISNPGADSISDCHDANPAHLPDSPVAADTSGPGGIARRSSSLSDYSFDARDVLDPQPTGLDPGTAPASESSWAYFSLASALVPAAAGVLFRDGGRMGTDVMLLAFASVFLHWSVIQPWKWYRSAQQVRVREESLLPELAVDDDDGDDDDGDYDSDGAEDSEDTAKPYKPVKSPVTSRPLGDIPEGRPGMVPSSSSPPPPSPPPPAPIPASADGKARRDRAVGELHVHEALALVSCFVFPLLGAYLLHALRSQLSQPSEGLVSDFNLTIFVMASELRAVSHVIKLVQSRTLFLQRVVAGHPFRAGAVATASDRIDALVSRVNDLEVRLAETARSPPSQPPPPQPASVASPPGPQPQRPQDSAVLLRDLRRSLQPDIDLLGKGLRRCEKRSITLALQVDARVHALDSRLDDAIALAAAAAKNSASRGSGVRQAADATVAAVLYPIHLAVRIVVFPFSALVTLLNRSWRKTDGRPPPTPAPAPHRPDRWERAPSATRAGSGRALPGRYPKR